MRKLFLWKNRKYIKNEADRALYNQKYKQLPDISKIILNKTYQKLDWATKLSVNEF